MKIYCDKCGEIINSPVNTAFENNRVGFIECPKCRTKQKRYISEADLLLYFGLSEILYLIVSIITMIMFGYVGVTMKTGAFIFVVLIIAFFGLKAISNNIYVKGYFKKKTMYTDLQEDAKAISGNLSRQLIFFFVIAITFITSPDNRIFFGILLGVAIVLNFIKLKFALEAEAEKAK